MHAWERSETVLLKRRKWKSHQVLRCLVISALLRVALLNESSWHYSFLSHLAWKAFLRTFLVPWSIPTEHSWYTVVRSRGFQFSGRRSRMGSSNPRKIGMGVPNILGFVARGCRFFFVTPVCMVAACTRVLHTMCFAGCVYTTSWGGTLVIDVANGEVGPCDEWFPLSKGSHICVACRSFRARSIFLDRWKSSLIAWSLDRSIGGSWSSKDKAPP